MNNELKAAELRGRAAGLLRSVLGAGGVNGAPLAFEGEGTTEIQLEAVRILMEADALLTEARELVAEIARARLETRL